jgi:hypothetical protein
MEKVKVYTPNKSFSGRRYGVVFENGVGEATLKEATILVANWGYSCPELQGAASAPPVKTDGEKEPVKTDGEKEPVKTDGENPNAGKVITSESKSKSSKKDGK